MTIEWNDPQVIVVLAMVNLDSHISLRQIEVQSGIPRSMAQRILRLHNFHSYHIALTQGLFPHDFQRKLAFFNWA